MPENETVSRNQKLIKTLAGGALWIIFGMFISRILGYGIRAAIGHFYGVENYGIINTALSLMMIFAIVALAGLNTGLPRQLSFYGARGEKKKTKSQVFSAFKIGILSGLFSALVLFLLAGTLANKVFHTPQLKLFIQIFSVGVPLIVLLELNTSVFKGLKQMSLFTFYHDILRFTIIFVLIFLLGIFHSSFKFIGIVYPVSYFIIVIITFLVLLKRTNVLGWGAISFNRTDREILAFSIPLMFSGIFWILLPRTDTILIGGFLNQEYVGLYNAAVPIGQLILIVRQAFSPIVLPLFTELLSRNQKDELALLYYISAKWTMILALPVFISMLLLPKFFIWFVFGRHFLAAAPVLQIVVIGFFIHTIVGPTSNLLIISGKTKQIMFNSLVAFLVSVILNILLIPKIQLFGAAIASVSAYSVFNLLNFIQVYRHLGVQPFKLLHFKFILAALIPIPILLQSPLLSSDAFPIFLYGIIYLILLWVVKAYKAEDKILFQTILNKFKK